MGLVVGDHSPVAIPARADLAHEDQPRRVRMQYFAYQLIGDVRTVELCGVDVIDPARDRLQILGGAGSVSLFPT